MGSKPKSFKHFCDPISFFSSTLTFKSKSPPHLIKTITVSSLWQHEKSLCACCFFVRLTSWLNTKHVYFNCLTWLIKLLFYKRTWAGNAFHKYFSRWTLFCLFPERLMVGRWIWTFCFCIPAHPPATYNMLAMIANPHVGRWLSSIKTSHEIKVIRRFIFIKCTY